ncbi:TPR repeat domain-containing protein [Ditylenchus destructor]|uniref:TPR repeat domain-containing protein n=1 Tax=Ditylenchus destructor TaxID=166010 RepID=A0AAD4R8R6_9BILA|nr:TPR repeat domain-containing protein [Ditylenchus destructor]
MADHIELLKQFVSLCKANPELLHDERYAFYKEYLESMDAKIPPAPGTKHTASSEKPSSESSKPHASATPEPEPPQAEPEEEEIALPELDESGVISPEEDEPLPMGDMDKEVTDEDLEKGNEHRDQATAAFSEGNYEESLKHYTAAIECNPKSAILHAKRANVLLKLSKPVAAIRDCDKAVQLNPDSAQGYKFRGRAYRFLGKWLEAKTDLALACKLDFDDTANEWLKEVEPNYC